MARPLVASRPSQRLGWATQNSTNPNQLNNLELLNLEFTSISIGSHSGPYKFTQRFEKSMSSSPSDQTQFSQLLENSVLSRLERLRLNPRRRLTVQHRGEHLQGKGGASTEFADYRDYVAGDDLRYIDWNIFLRLNRPFIKQFRHEEEMHIVVLIDASSSMNFDGKFRLARQLAGACAIMGLMGNERVSIYCCHGNDVGYAMLPPVSGRVSLRRVLRFLEEQAAGGDYGIDEAIEDVLKRHRGRGMAVLLSDFLTFGNLERPLNLLFGAGLEVSAVQILSLEEMQPDLTGDIRLVDSENGLTLDVSGAGELAGLYQEHLQILHATLTDACQRRLGRFLQVESTATVDSIVFDTWRRKGWVR